MQVPIRDASKPDSDSVPALKSVTLTIPRGLRGLVGPSGTGKSTLMRILAALLRGISATVPIGLTHQNSPFSAPAL